MKLKHPSPMKQRSHERKVSRWNPRIDFDSLNLCINSSSSKQTSSRTHINIRCRSGSPKNVKVTRLGMKDSIDYDPLPLASGKKIVEDESIMAPCAVMLFREWIQVTSVFLCCNESPGGLANPKSL